MIKKVAAFCANKMIYYGKVSNRNYNMKDGIFTMNRAAKRTVIFIQLVAVMVCILGCRSTALDSLQPIVVQTEIAPAESTEEKTEDIIGQMPTNPMEAYELPKTVIEDMYNECGNVLFLKLTQGNGTEIGTYETRRMLDNLAGKWSDFTPTQETNVSDCTEWFTIESGDGTRTITIYKQDPLCVRYEKDGEIWWYLDEKNLDSYVYGIAKAVISEMELMSFLPISFADDGNEPLNTYAKTAYPSRLAELTYGNLNRIMGYSVVSVEVDRAYENAVSGTVIYAGIPETEVNTLSLIRIEQGTGEFEGRILYKKAVFLEKQEDEKWHEISAPVFGDSVLESSVFNRRDDTVVLSNSTAEAILHEASTTLALVREHTSDYEIVNGMAELFLQVVRATAWCNTEAADFAPFFSENASQKFGVLNLMNVVYWENAKNYFKKLELPYTPGGIYVKEDTATVDNGNIILYFIKSDGTWLITDVSLPWYP